MTLGFKMLSWAYGLHQDFKDLDHSFQNAWQGMGALKWSRSGLESRKLRWVNQCNRLKPLKSKLKNYTVSMSGSRTGFPKYSVSGTQNYFLQISVNNVKPCLYGWILIGELGTHYIESNHKNYNFLDCDWFKKLLFSH